MYVCRHTCQHPEYGEASLRRAASLCLSSFSVFSLCLCLRVMLCCVGVALCVVVVVVVVVVVEEVVVVVVEDGKGERD